MRIKKIEKVANVFSTTGKYLRLAKKKDADVIDLKSLWAKEMVNHFNLAIQVKGRPNNLQESSIFIGNHISYLDIPILIFSCPEISFVGKKEIKSWPIIGNAAIKAQTIFVERSSKMSRSSAKIEIAKSLLVNKQKVAVFPSGTTSVHPSPRWKKGVFEIAQENNIKIQPFRVHYEPLRDSAYIDKDNFLFHMYKLFALKTIAVSLEFHEPVEVKNSLVDCLYWKQWCEEFHPQALLGSC